MMKSKRLLSTLRQRSPFRAYKYRKESMPIFTSISTFTSSIPLPPLTRSNISFGLILIITYIILSSIYLDTLIASTLFARKHVTEMELDDNLRHLLPQIPPGGIPTPSDILGVHSSIVLRPTMGYHRPDQDAIFSIADGLELADLALFVVTLRSTGFEGDIVFSAWPRASMPEGVYEFLEHYSNDGLVVYENAIIADNDSQLIHLHEVNVTNVWLRGLYGHANAETESESESEASKTEDGENEVYLDPRPARSLGIARFELFWVWAKNYKTQSRILLIDAKDTYFQIDGEVGIGVGRTCSESSPSVLHLYEENAKKVKLGSIQNRAHLVDAYKDKRIMKFLHNQNVLTPASTHGPKKAIEAYLRAMVQQFDNTGCTLYQCEWAFHNYIYSFSVLSQMEEIDFVKTHFQGTGAVNSVGYNVPLSGGNQTDLFDIETYAVLNRRMGHGAHNSWAVHQYDRDPELHDAVDDMMDYILGELNYSDPIHTPVSFFHAENVVRDVKLRTKPSMGEHRPREDAIFSFLFEASLDDVRLFILSVRKSGFEGDIVLNTPMRNEMGPNLVNFLKHHSRNGVVIYEGFKINFLEGDYVFKLDMEDIIVEVAKFEYFYVWAQNYENNQIMIIDGEYSYFQSNPFALSYKDCGRLTLNFYEESKYTLDFNVLRLDNKEIWEAMIAVFGMDSKSLHQKLKMDNVLNPTAFFGHQRVLEKYLFSLVDLFEKTKCVSFGCDYAGVNYMWYEEIAHIGSPISVNLRLNHHGGHAINTGIPASLKFLEKKSLFYYEEKVYLNWDGQPSPVVLKGYLNHQMVSFFADRVAELLEEFPITLYKDK